MKSALRFAVALGLGVALFSPSTSWAQEPSQPLAGPDVVDREIERGETVGQPPVTQPRPVVVPPPPAPVIKTEVYQKPDCKTMTGRPCWATRDISGTGYSVMRPVNRYMDNGRIVLSAPNDDWVRNNQPGGDLNLFSEQRSARMFVWADQIQSGMSPQRAINNFISGTKAAVCGEWKGPEPFNVAGIPVYKGWGYDVFGNYYFEVYSWQRYGMQYTLATRTPYTNRWDVGLNSDVAYFITHAHPSTSSVLASLKRKR